MLPLGSLSTSAPPTPRCSTCSSGSPRPPDASRSTCPPRCPRSRHHRAISRSVPKVPSFGSATDSTWDRQLLLGIGGPVLRRGRRSTNRSDGDSPSVGQDVQAVASLGGGWGFLPVGFTVQMTRTGEPQDAHSLARDCSDRVQRARPDHYREALVCSHMVPMLIWASECTSSTRGAVAVQRVARLAQGRGRASSSFRTPPGCCHC